MQNVTAEVHVAVEIVVATVVHAAKAVVVVMVIITAADADIANINRKLH